MANPFERCPSIWQGTDKNRTQVRCDRWGGHEGEHYGFDDQDIACRWSDEHVPWNQPVPNNLEVDETVTAENQRAVLRIELQQWKDRCLIAERAWDQHYRAWVEATERQDETRIGQLEKQVEELQQEIRRLEVYERTVDSLGTGKDGELIQAILNLTKRLADA